MRTPPASPQSPSGPGRRGGRHVTPQRRFRGPGVGESDIPGQGVQPSSPPGVAPWQVDRQACVPGDWQDAARARQDLPPKPRPPTRGLERGAQQGRRRRAAERTPKRNPSWWIRAREPNRWVRGRVGQQALGARGYVLCLQAAGHSLRMPLSKQHLRWKCRRRLTRPKRGVHFHLGAGTSPGAARSSHR
jgi:hypothetical protein